MKPYKPFTDRFGRILARCPKCHDLWKTEEVWSDMRKEVRRQALYDAASVAGDMGAVPVEERLREEINKLMRS